MMNLPDPQAEDMQAHIEWLEANWIAWGNPAVRALIAAVQAGAVERERLRAIEARALDLEKWNRFGNRAQASVSYILHGEATDAG